MGRSESYMIPARFLITIGHLIASIIVYYHIDDNVTANLGANPSASDKQSSTDELTQAWVLGISCFAFDILGLFGGFSIFFSSVNLFQSVAHFLGALYTVWFVTGSWHPSTFWYIAVFFSLIPALLELFVLFSIFVFKTVRY